MVSECIRGKKSERPLSFVLLFRSDQVRSGGSSLREPATQESREAALGMLSTLSKSDLSDKWDEAAT